MKKTKKYVTGKDIRRNYRIFLIGAVFAFIFGLYIILVITLNPTPAYENLQNDTIVVDNIKYYTGVKGGSYYGLTSTDGIKYHLSGDFSFKILEEKLIYGTEILIKWHNKDKLMFERFYIEEIYLDGEKLSTYTNDDKASNIFAYVGGSAMFILGIAAIIFYHHIVAKEIRNLPKKHRN
ncbi:MAG: hypothetical protein E7608_04770 [Ruminococcaceae bacterium]|nr:hypothetical protein [Oscillospiraceae bacterium]